MKRIALLGMPNTGKSTLFNRLTGASARVGNWPGMTVDLLAAKILLGGHLAELVDLPGIYDLHGYADDEKLVRHFLGSQPIDLLAVLVNATQLERQLVLALQLKELGFPIVLLVNMIDEARTLGIGIDTAALAAGLGLPVVAISAKYGEGQAAMLAALGRQLQIHPAETQDIPEAAKERLGADDAIETQVATLLQRAVSTPAVLPPRFSDRLDSLLMHNVLGLPLFFLAMFGVFSGVFWLGAPLQDGLKTLFEAFSSHV